MVGRINERGRGAVAEVGQVEAVRLSHRDHSGGPLVALVARVLDQVDPGLGEQLGHRLAVALASSRRLAAMGHGPGPFAACQHEQRKAGCDPGSSPGRQPRGCPPVRDVTELPQSDEADPADADAGHELRAQGRRQHPLERSGSAWKLTRMRRPMTPRMVGIFMVAPPSAEYQTPGREERVPSLPDGQGPAPSGAVSRTSGLSIGATPRPAPLAHPPARDRPPNLPAPGD